jgi:hypothetical protein
MADTMYTKNKMRRILLFANMNSNTGVKGSVASRYTADRDGVGGGCGVADTDGIGDGGGVADTD